MVKYVVCTFGGPFVRLKALRYPPCASRALPLAVRRVSTGLPNSENRGLLAPRQSETSDT